MRRIADIFINDIAVSASPPDGTAACVTGLLLYPFPVVSRRTVIHLLTFVRHSFIWLTGWYILTENPFAHRPEFQVGKHFTFLCPISLP
ncbi:MAG: hypothetical protein U0T56_04020 [Ferruginibacter sp.]